MKLIFKYLLKYKKLFLLNILAITLIASAEFGIPMILKEVFDRALPGSNPNLELVYKLGIILAVVAILGTLGHILINYVSTKTATLILTDLRRDVFRKVQTFSPEEINEYGISSLITRTTGDVFQILNFVSTFYRTAIMAPIMIIISLVLILKKTPTLANTLLFAIPVVVAGIIVVIILSKPLSEKQQQNLDNLNLVTRENLTGVRVVRAFRKNEYEAERFQEANNEYTSNAMKLFKLMSSTEPIFFFLLNLSFTITLWFAGKYILSPDSTITVGNLIEFNDYHFLIMHNILMFSILFILYPRTMVSARRIEAILNKDVAVKNKPNALTYVEPKGTLEFNNVTFQYPDGEIPVLKNINFSAKKGETIAFIGSTGSGKSTLINLIPRLYNVTEGEILIDGVNVNDYDLTYLRNKIGFIAQKAILFKGSIADNIRFGKHDASLEEVMEAAKIAQAHDFILEKEGQYEHMVSELGSNLSGGQKQRLSIARAIIKNPDIYIFDDSFSALDYKTDAALRKVLVDHSKNAITLIVAQRITSIVNADQIIVLNEGEIVGIGKHEELLKSCQVYKEISASQLTEEELA